MRIWLALLLVTSAICSTPQKATISVGRSGVRRFSGLHTDGTLSVLFLNAGRQAISSGVDDTARIWDVARGVELKRFSGPQFHFQSIAISPDGCCAFTPATNGTVNYWTIATGKNLFSVASTNAATVALSADGKMAAAGGQDTSIHVWRVPEGKEAGRFAVDAAVVRVAFSSAGDVRFVLADGRVCTAHLPAGAAACVSAISDPVSQAAFSSGASRVLIGGRYGALVLWDADHSTLIRKLNVTSSDIVALAFSPDGAQALLGASDKQVTFFNLDGRQTRSITARGAYVSCVAFSPDGTQAIFGTDNGTVAVWPLK